MEVKWGVHYERGDDFFFVTKKNNVVFYFSTDCLEKIKWDM